MLAVFFYKHILLSLRNVKPSPSVTLVSWQLIAANKRAFVGQQHAASWKHGRCATWQLLQRRTALKVYFSQRKQAWKCTGRMYDIFIWARGRATLRFQEIIFWTFCVFVSWVPGFCKRRAVKLWEERREREKARKPLVACNSWLILPHTNRFELGSRSDLASWLEEVLTAYSDWLLLTDRCAVIGCLLIDSRDTYRGGIRITRN